VFLEIVCGAMNVKRIEFRTFIEINILDCETLKHMRCEVDVAHEKERQ
jgi:hypothetical protein